MTIGNLGHGADHAGCDALAAWRRSTPGTLLDIVSAAHGCHLRLVARMTPDACCRFNTDAQVRFGTRSDTERAS